MIQMLFARASGEWMDIPPLAFVASCGNRLLCPTKADLIPLPEGATLTMMPGAHPYGFDPQTGEFLLVDQNPYNKKVEPIYALAALLPQGFTRTLMPAATKSKKTLPLLGYTAVGILKGKLMVAAMQTDEHERWHPKHYNTPDLPDLVKKKKQQFPDNRIIAQLAHCSLEYGCFTAQNIFYGRWEGGIPVSPACNADCIGCISLQKSECCPSPQERIDFVPTEKEVAEMAVCHLDSSNDAIVSFGQGCEGEPSLQHQLIAASIKEIRNKTKKGSINMNTNAGDTKAIQKIVEAGIDSLRVSLFSPVAAEYDAYHRPKNYHLQDVCISLRLAEEAGVPVSLNLLTYPGFTDDKIRVDALIALIHKYGIRQIQFRNLNLDPALMQPFIKESKPIGIGAMIGRLQQEVPTLAIGNYSKIWD